MKPKLPLQPLAVDPDGVVRFRPNRIVRFLLDSGPYDMNQIAAMPFVREDREQFASLIGYSACGFGELPYASAAAVAETDEAAARLLAARTVARLKPKPRSRR